MRRALALAAGLVLLVLLALLALAPAAAWVAATLGPR